ncbi:MAG: hypothetical protein P4L71_01920 [Acetobacteraceae bacterium]|nr:hypothetical protein [Acetobacteraceae bacterium]
MFDQPARAPPLGAPAVTGALERAAAAIARLDQALAGHPLLPAFLYRARLDAVRRQAAVDGLAIDPWHLAAMLEGLRLRMDGALRIVDRGAIFAAARHALGLHQWLVAPDFDQERDVQAAARALDQPLAAASPLLAAALGMHHWLQQGGSRPPIRAALVRHWTRHGLLRAPVPLTGPRALGAAVPFARDLWVPIFLDALADEAADSLHLLTDMERTWRAAHGAASGRRRSSRAAMAIDLLAAAPLASPTTLAGGLGMAVKNATALLEAFVTAGIAVEVTHRAKRRLFGLSGLAPLRDQVAPPRHPEPGRGPGRPRTVLPQDVPPCPAPPTTPPVPVDRQPIDYADLQLWMENADRVIRDTRRTLDSFARGVGGYECLITRAGC